jgi:hypothetical protein
MELRLLGIGIIVTLLMTLIVVALDKPPLMLTPRQALDHTEYLGQKVQVQGNVTAERYCDRRVCGINSYPFCNVCRARFYISYNGYKLLLAKKSTQWLCAGTNAGLRCLQQFQIGKIQKIDGTLRQTRAQGKWMTYLDVG